MDLYRRMAAIRSQSDADELLDEIVDRYGDPPRGVLNLIDVALLRAKAAPLAVTDITQKGREILFTLLALDFETLSALCAAPGLAGRLFLLPKSKQPLLRLRLAEGENSLKAAGLLVDALAELVMPKQDEN
jgi:transcription-repair coupling factor (superfamily II helicase)